jgi:glycosyltransferase involved in cell wall biosynthesis
MIIAVNTRLLIPGKIEGIGRFALETLRIITQKHPEHRFIFIFDRKYSGEFMFSSNITPVICFPPARHPLLWYLYFEGSLPGILKKYQADLFFSPDGWLSLRADIKSLPVIHDLNFLHFPEFIPFHIRQYYHYFFPRFMQKASRIATVSEFTRNDICSRFGYPESRIDVVYNGADGFNPLNELDIQKFRLEYTRGEPYFLFVGLIHPRKNLANLMLSYDRFRSETPSRVKLLVVGERKWWTDDMKNAYEKCRYRYDIILTGRLPDDVLKRAVASALGLVYVSYFEGFGIPVLEAMNADVPVICSSTSSLPEVGGDAVIYADPADVESIKTAMVNLYLSPDLRRALIMKSRIRRAQFSWNKTADLLWKSIEQCL